MFVHVLWHLVEQDLKQQHSGGERNALHLFSLVSLLFSYIQIIQEWRANLGQVFDRFWVSVKQM